MKCRGPIVALSIIILCAKAYGGGSFGLERVMPLLKQNESIYLFVMDTLDLESGGWAVRIGSNVNPDLGGARIAPYTIRAKRKGAKGDWTYLLQINAETTYYDSNGKDVPLQEGKTIKEKLVGIELLPIPQSDLKTADQGASANP